MKQSSSADFLAQWFNLGLHLFLTSLFVGDDNLRDRNSSGYQRDERNYQDSHIPNSLIQRINFGIYRLNFEPDVFPCTLFGRGHCVFDNRAYLFFNVGHARSSLVSSPNSGCCQED